MKRVHIHIGVADLAEGISFYSALFGAAPVKVKDDYAKWMLDDPRLNLAISTGEGRGVDHLGIQTDDADELALVRDQLTSADMKTFEEGETVCCYASSDKTWVMDPAGVAWEAYHTMADAEKFHGEPMTIRGGAVTPPAPAADEAQVNDPVPVGVGCGCC